MPKIVANRIDWIKLGHELFTQAGEKGIVIEQMAKRLECNKSSFYWHFKTKKAFIDAIVEYWIELDTNQIISAVSKEETAEAQFHQLIKLTFKKDPYQDFVFYLKRYAQSNAALNQLIDQIDQDRINFVADLLIKLGYTSKEAIAKAQLFYKYLIGYHEMIRYKKQSRQYVKEVRKELHHFIDKL